MNTRRFHTINILILITLIIVPSLALASVPTTTSFDRENEYDFDGFRDGGYYVIRHNSSNRGFMNMSHVGGTNIFNITSNNIKNLTLDLDDMFDRRSWLFGWGNVSFADMTDALNGRIVINLNSTDSGIEELRFVDHPNVYVMVWVDDVVVRDWSELEDVEIYSENLNSEIVLDFSIGYSTYFIMSNLLILAVLVGVSWLALRLVWRALFWDGTIYMEYWRKSG